MIKEIYLAGGCFWGVDAYYNTLKGVITTNSGYANGNYANPTYEEVVSSKATHAETVYIKYDSDVISLAKILEHYFKIVNPFTLNRQGNDVGIQYRSGIYYNDLETKEYVENYLENIQSKTTRKIVVEVKELENYYPAEDYHQDYLIKNPNGYCHVDLSIIKEEDKK